uniref:Uncharacterized protein n=1 Tax=Plectus sambesii TaxID=2011161 RepID=A0A914XRR8_9BILA
MSASGSVASVPPYNPSVQQAAMMQQGLPQQQQQQQQTASTSAAQPQGIQAVQEMAVNGQHLVRALRASMQKTLQQLMIGPQGEGASSDRFGAEVKKRLTAVHEQYEVLETLSKQLPKTTPTNAIIDRLTKLLQEGQIDSETDQLYIHLLDSVNWNESNTQFLFYVNKFLRSYCRKRPSLMMPRLIAPSSVDVQTTPQQSFYNQLQTVSKDKRLNMQIDLIEKTRSSGVVEVIIGHVVEMERKTFSPTLKLLLLVNNAVPEMVQVKAFNEEWGYIDGQVDLFDESRHLVYRKISAQMNAQIMQIFIPGITELRDGNSSLQLLLLWFSRYTAIFDQPCRVCKKILKDFIPPTYIDLRINIAVATQPLHETCR